MRLKSDIAEVTFIRPAGELEIRMMDCTVNRICEAAVLLKATHFVTIDGWSHVIGKPEWGVFEMRTAEKDTPIRGEWSVRDPIRKFAADKADAAVMFAITLAGRR